jgi:hypothetical protein
MLQPAWLLVDQVVALRFFKPPQKILNLVLGRLFAGLVAPAEAGPPAHGDVHQVRCVALLPVIRDLNLRQRST